MKMVTKMEEALTRVNIFMPGSMKHYGRQEQKFSGGCRTKHVRLETETTIKQGQYQLRDIVPATSQSEKAKHAVYRTCQKSQKLI